MTDHISQATHSSQRKTRSVQQIKKDAKARPRMGEKMAKKASRTPRSGTAPTKDNAIAQLKCVIDPHTNISVYDMKLISDLRVTPQSISLVFRPTSPFCPVAFSLARSIKGVMWNLDGVTDVSVVVVGHYQEDTINNALKELTPGDSSKGKRSASK